MVTFVCGNCGTSLKKNQVEKHTFQCRTSSFSCIDCNKDFGGDEYKAHTKCISEIERYSAKGWKPPANHNKGEKKQDEWVSIVQATLEKHANSISPSSRNLLHTIAKHDNVPRKKPKFINFIKNVSRNGFNEVTVNEVWGILETEWKNAKQPPVSKIEEPPKEAEKSAEVEVEPEGGTKKKKKKKKQSESDLEPEKTITADPAPFSVSDVPDPEDGVGKKKKKKKKKPSESEALVEPEHGAVVINGEEAQENGISKKKKRKKHLDTDMCEAPDTGILNGNSAGEVEAVDSIKKKKRKKSTNVQE